MEKQEEETLEEAKKIKRKEMPDLDDAVRIRSAPRTLLQLEPEKAFKYARCGMAETGDLLKDRGERKYIVIGDAPPGKPVKRMRFEGIGHEEEKLPMYLRELIEDPGPGELMNSQKNDTWPLLVGFQRDLTEMEYSYRMTAYRYKSTKSDVKPWLIDAMFSKTRFSGGEVRKLVGTAPVVTYGFCRWSKTGYLRYHILTALPYESTQ